MFIATTKDKKVLVVIIHLLLQVSKNINNFKWKLNIFHICTTVSD